MEYLRVVRREFQKVKHNDTKVHIDICIPVEELNNYVEDVILKLDMNTYFNILNKNIIRSQQLENAVEELVSECEEYNQDIFLETIKRHLKTKPLIYSKYSFMYITVRPPDDKYTPKLFLEHILRVLDGKDYEFVIEQCGTNDYTMGEGFHVHIILMRDMYKPPKQDKQNIKDRISKYGNTKITWHIIDHLNDKRFYMGKHELTSGNLESVRQSLQNIPNYGWKGKEYKNQRLLTDFDFRETHSMCHYYGEIDD